METSAEIKQLAKALKEFQKNAPAVTKDANAVYDRYATLGNVIETTREQLAKHGLAFAQLPDGNGLTTILMHDSGEWIKATADLLLDKQTPQGQGSAITYMRRYSLSAMLGIATEEDDDGAAASKPAPARQAAPTRTEAPKPTKDAKAHQEAAKDRIRTLLGQLGLPHKTVKETSDSVFKVTGFLLAPENYEQIGEAEAEK